MFRTRFLTLLFSGTVLLLTSTQAFSQLREDLLDEVNSRLDQADREDLARLSPKNYQKASQLCSEARRMYETGKKLEQIQKGIDRCLTGLATAFKSAELSRTVLGEVLELRRGIIDTKLPVTSYKAFREADKALREATLRVEKDNVKSARNSGRQASKMYREAAIEGLMKAEVESSLQRLKNARKSMDKQAYQDAEKSLQQIKKTLNQQKKNDFDTGQLVSRTREDVDRVLGRVGLQRM